jgi:hypothetical protein
LLAPDINKLVVKAESVKSAVPVVNKVPGAEYTVISNSPQIFIGTTLFSVLTDQLSNAGGAGVDVGVGVDAGVDDGVDDGVGGGPEQALPCIKSTPDNVNGVGLAQIELPSGTFSAK